MKLEVKEHKKLILKKIVVHELRNIRIEDLEDEIGNFINNLQVINVQLFGPLVTKLIGTKIHDDGNMTFDYDIMLQAHDYQLYKNRFKISDEHVCEHCLYVNFKGKSEHTHYAHTKLELYIFENDLTSNGIIYNVYISNDPDLTEIDIFRPVTSHEAL